MAFGLKGDALNADVKRRAKMRAADDLVNLCGWAAMAGTPAVPYCSGCGHHSEAPLKKQPNCEYCGRDRNDYEKWLKVAEKMRGYPLPKPVPTSGPYGKPLRRKRK
jgi:hypothetical protein